LRETGGTLLWPPWDRNRDSHQKKPKTEGILYHSSARLKAIA